MCYFFFSRDETISHSGNAFCNPAIKFGRLAQIARERGADRLATGHYARIRSDKDGSLHLLKAVDKTKDQSYFLARLRPEHLAFSLFPTGMEDLMAVADAGEVMPPKSTWFEPKLADGLVSHVLD